jgi:hypothetical protein
MMHKYKTQVLIRIMKLLIQKTYKYGEAELTNRFNDNSFPCDRRFFI